MTFLLEQYKCDGECSLGIIRAWGAEAVCVDDIVNGDKLPSSCDNFAGLFCIGNKDREWNRTFRRKKTHQIELDRMKF